MTNPGFSDVPGPGIQNLVQNQGTTEIIAPVPNLQTDSILTASNLKDNFLFGVPGVSKIFPLFNGQVMSDDNIRFQIDAATGWLENYLQINIKQKYYAQERQDYIRSEYFNWGLIRLYHIPILKLVQFLVIYPDTNQTVEFPLKWIQTDMEGNNGVLNIVPGVGSATSFIIGQGSTLLPLLFNTQEYLPGLYKISYISGFPNNKCPYNIQQVIGKKAAIDILTQVSNALLYQGTIGESISLDGVSESVQKLPFIYEKQIRLWKEQIEEEISELRSYWGGMRMAVA
jgi:hypothetical protein